MSNPILSTLILITTFAVAVNFSCSDKVTGSKTNEIPSVQNISAIYDTVTGIVTLKWQPAKYNNLKDYIIYRDAEQAGAIFPTAYRASVDTTFIDTVFNINKIPLDTQTITYIYRVAIRNKLTVIGNPFGSDTVTVVPYKSVLPVVDSLKVTFDTASGTANVTWKSIPLIDSNYSYYVLRNCAAYNKVITDSTTPLFSTIDTLGFLKQTTFADSLYRKKLSFQDTLFYKVSYSVSVYRKNWKLFGKNRTSALLSISPYKNLVSQIPKGVIIFDTLHGVAKLSWDSIPASSGIIGFKIIRNITNSPTSINKTDTLPLWKSNQFSDTIYPKIIPFDTIGEMHLSYSIAGFHTVWGIYGNATTISAGVVSYHTFKPQISAGENQTVDISSDVFLNGKVLSSKFPIVKQEWKIGDSSWVVVDSGKIQFRTNNNLSCDTIHCIFRVTDSVGAIEDTVKVIKKPLIVSLTGIFPGVRDANKFIYTPGITIKINTSDTNEYLIFNGFGIFSTINFQDYTPLNDNNFPLKSPQYTAYGDLVNGDYTFLTFRNKYYLYNWKYKSYSSTDAVSWSEIQPVFTTPNARAICEPIVFHNKLFLITNDGKLNTSTDGVNFDTLHQNTIIDGNMLFNVGDKLVKATRNGESKASSINEGATWQWDNLWKSATVLYTFACSDSVTIVTYYDKADSKNHMSIFKNGNWQIVPAYITNVVLEEQDYHDRIYITGNRCIVLTGRQDLVDPVYFHMFKIY